ncbi:hypothetical protein ACIPW5_21460 [Streptomyces sp. NPDC090077]|uniref:hypothetical protein n=1 Tax=Streptomyces sp. NPDC090077 TaxID=3365938 RepID=UPI0037F404E1
MGQQGGGRHDEPQGWRTGPAWREMEGRGRGRRRLKTAAVLVALGAAALVVVRPELLIDRVTGEAEARRTAAEAPPLPAESVRPTAAPEAAYPDRPTPKEPFRGSPAAQWADGAAGIEVPEATAVGGMSKEAVAEALAKAKQFLVGANLDPATLRGERPEAAMALLDPKDEKTRTAMAKAFERPGRDQDPLDWFTRYDPAELKPAGDVVKVRGRMWVEAGEQPGQAHVRADYSFVYPFTRAGGNPEDVARTIVRRELTFSIADPDRWEGTPGRLWLFQVDRDVANSSCDRFDGRLHPSFFSDPDDGGTVPSGPPVDPYDRSRGIRVEGQDGCGTVSRT